MLYVLLLHPGKFKSFEFVIENTVKRIDVILLK